MIAETARGRRQERSKSREVKTCRAAEVGRASSRLSRSQSRDKRIELDGPKSVQVKLEMIERNRNHQKNPAQRTTTNEEVISISSTEENHKEAKK